jgi:hypothetical protein
MPDPSQLQVINALNLIVCSGCPKPQPLTTLTNQVTTCDDQFCATIADCAPGANILPFGPCAFTPAPPSPSGGPCIPKPVGQWAPGSITTTYQGHRALRQQDKLTCATGGVITILQPGQSHTFVE